MSHIPFCLQKQDQYIMPEANSLLPLSSNPLLLAWLDDSVATSCKIPLPADTLLDFVGRGRWRDRASESRERERNLSSWWGCYSSPVRHSCWRLAEDLRDLRTGWAPSGQSPARQPCLPTVQELWLVTHTHPPPLCALQGNSLSSVDTAHLQPVLIPNPGVVGRSLPNFFPPWVLTLSPGDISP